MKKTFPLQIPGKVDQRVVETVKNDLRKYVKRERRKTLPEGFSRWNFNCKIGPNLVSAVPCQLADLTGMIDQIVTAGGTEVYVEILAEPGRRVLSDEAPPSEQRD